MASPYLFLKNVFLFVSPMASPYLFLKNIFLFVSPMASPCSFLKNIFLFVSPMASPYLFLKNIFLFVSPMASPLQEHFVQGELSVQILPDFILRSGIQGRRHQLLVNTRIALQHSAIEKKKRSKY